MNVQLELILLLALFSPLTEAFPNLYMSWWVPSNGRLQRYVQTWPRRILVVLTVWLPILIILSKVINPPELIWILGALIFSAFGLRLLVLDRSLTTGPKKIGLSKLPEFLYFIAFSSIGAVLYAAVPNNQWLVPAAIATIYLGALAIGTFRQGARKNLSLDILGRLIFIAGFLLNLYNLARSASTVLS